MAILSKNVLAHHSPYIEFADCPRRLDIADWPNRSLYENHVFYEFADDLMGTLCELTHSCPFFDVYGLTQIDEPHEILTLASEFLLWAFQLARYRTTDFEKELSIYEKSSPLSDNVTPSAETLQHDLIETLLFIAGRLNLIAQAKRCLVIVGI